MSKCPSPFDSVYFKDSRSMKEIPDNSVQLVITSPPYFNIKDYSLDGKQSVQNADRKKGQIGDIPEYEEYICSMLEVWRECERVLVPNGKLVINVPLMPILKKQMNTHHTRHIFDINSDIQSSIISNLSNTFLLDVYIWERTNSSKKLMFGSYPSPGNLYAQNTLEFMTVYVKGGKPSQRSQEIKDSSKLSRAEWVEFTKQIWRLPIPNKKDPAYGTHSALMPAEIASRFIKMFSFVGDVVLDPFTGSGTTLSEAVRLNRRYVGYEISDHYRDIIQKKISVAHD